MPRKNYDGSVANMRAVWLEANQAWTVLWNGDPIAIRDRLFWVGRRELALNLEAIGLDLAKDGTISRWCPVGRHLNGFDARIWNMDLCPNHATQDSQFCDRHRHVKTFA